MEAKKERQPRLDEHQKSVVKTKLISLHDLIMKVFVVLLVSRHSKQPTVTHLHTAAITLHFMVIEHRGVNGEKNHE